MQCTFFFYWSLVWIFDLKAQHHFQSPHISISITNKYLQMFVWWRWRTVRVNFSWTFLNFFPILSCYCCRRGCVFPSKPSWFVGLWAGWNKNYRTDFHKTWMKEGSLPRLEPINFWCRSLNLFWLSLTLRHGAFFNIFDNFSGNSAWILMKICELVQFDDNRRVSLNWVLYWVLSEVVSDWI